LRLRIEETVLINGRYKTLFEGLKLNQPHNSAVTYPFAFMLRRLVYAVAIVFMAHMPQIASLVMLCMTVAILAFILIENPWKDSQHQQLDIANEIFLYLVLTLILTSSCL
jgi:hypothetical protein